MVMSCTLCNVLGPFRLIQYVWGINRITVKCYMNAVESAIWEAYEQQGEQTPVKKGSNRVNVLEEKRDGINGFYSFLTVTCLILQLPLTTLKLA